MHKQLHEGLKSGDLKDLIKPVFEIDSYKSKMGDDENVVVLAFEVVGKQPAADLVDFVEKGYDFVLDADSSGGEDENGAYKVFVEIERSRKIERQINELMYGLSELSDMENWRFRYYKDYHSKSVSEMSGAIPSSSEEYNARIERIFENEMRHFFRKSPLDYLLIENDIVRFKRPFNNPINMKLVQHGNRDIISSLAGAVRVDEGSMSETIWLTKYFGNYNITKYGEDFVFENENVVYVFNLLK